MSYFNHAFRKTLVATSNSGPVSSLNGVQLGTSVANTLAAGQITFINPDTFQVTPTLTSLTCCEVIIAAGSLMQKDKIGPFHGGYLESNKTKTIKAKYTNRVYAIPATTAQNYILHVGVTPWTLLNPPVSSDPGETAGTCCKQFLCGETYYLRVDVKGSPALRLLDHNSYLTLEAYTGCCDDTLVAPNAVDPRRVYIQWAKQIRNSKLMNQFVFPIVTFTTNNGTSWTYYYPDDINVASLTPIAGVTFRNYSAFGTPADPDNGYQVGDCAGLVLNGAYEETKFGTCTFQISDFYELEPVRIYASEVDLTGSPCEFEGLCVGVQCYGRQANGVGETVVRDVILSESYRQNHFATDLRIREITQGYDLYTNAGLSRTAFYDRIYLQHNVPRMYNPTGTFDNDQYLIEIVLPANPALNGTLNVNTTNLLNQIQTWLNNCGAQCVVETVGSGTACQASSPAVPLPLNPSPVI
jgi:hypothetical protein